MSAEPYEYIECRAWCRAVGELLRMGHFEAAFHLWHNRRPNSIIGGYDRKYMLRAWVANEDLEVIEKYQKFLSIGRF